MTEIRVSDLMKDISSTKYSLQQAITLYKSSSSELQKTTADQVKELEEVSIYFV
jgi:hypothetical protein